MSYDMIYTVGPFGDHEMPMNLACRNGTWEEEDHPVLPATGWFDVEQNQGNLRDEEAARWAVLTSPWYVVTPHWYEYRILDNPDNSPVLRWTGSQSARQDHIMTWWPFCGW